MKGIRLESSGTPAEGWQKLAEKGRLAAVIDPNDVKGRKNLYIDTLQKIAVQRALKREEGRFILDFGCGNGRFSDLLAKRCEFLVGVEITGDMLRLAKEERECSNIGLVLFDGLSLPLQEGKVDAAISVNVLQYVTDDSELKMVLSEVHRSLKPEGRFVCVEQVTNNKKRWQRSLKEYLGVFEQNDFVVTADYPIRKGHFLLLCPIYFGLIPKALLGAVARLELSLRRILWHSPWDYQEHLFEFEKR
jgi:SAM-dependent methyltransferase